MHTVKTNERRGLSKALGLAVAGATLLAGLVALPATQASAAGFAPEDDFVEGALDNSKTPQLTVTKFLSGSNGIAATGSITDRPIGTGTPAKDIVFNVREVKAKDGMGIAEIKADDETTFDYVSGGIYAAGMTNGQGVIDSWFKANPTNGAPTTDPVTFPTSQHFYVMTENTAVSPGFDQAKYYESAPSFFGLPYRTTDTDSNPAKSGYLYHLHVFPKNVSKGSLTKNVTAVNRGQEAVSIAQAGDVISYKVSQKIYNEGSAAAANDQKLDISELSSTPNQYKDLRIVDRMGSALEMQSDSISARITWTGGKSADLDKTSDYKVTTQTTKPGRLLNDDKFFAGDPDVGTYTVFDFFGNAATIRQIAADARDATGNVPSELNVEVTYQAKVTAQGDSVGDGGVANKVQSDYTDNRNSVSPVTPPSDGTITPSGTVAFGKVQKDGNNVKALQGANFRLAKADEPTHYLATDGAFHATSDSGVTFFNATSTSTGLVAFTGLPILDSSKNGIAADWVIVETSAPDGFTTAPNPFAKVHFDQNVAGKSEQQIVDHYGSNPIEPDYNELSFGVYAPKGNPTVTDPIKFNGKVVAKLMMNYAKSDTDAPLGLPLTGGRGIILLLIVGVAIMGGALYMRNRRNAARTA